MVNKKADSDELVFFLDTKGKSDKILKSWHLRLESAKKLINNLSNIYEFETTTR